MKGAAASFGANWAWENQQQFVILCISGFVLHSLFLLFLFFSIYATVFFFFSFSFSFSCFFLGGVCGIVLLCSDATIKSVQTHSVGRSVSLVKNTKQSVVG